MSAAVTPAIWIRRLFILLLQLSFSVLTYAAFEDPPGLTYRDRIRLAEAFQIANHVSNSIWAGWKHTQFSIILVTPSHEFLLRHPNPSNNFQTLDFDTLLNTSIAVRKRSYPANFLATFPAIDATSTIVVGQAEQTMANNSTLWLVTLFHEHFHQFQYGQPGYFDKVSGLGLSGGDQTGMWMLSYPFPYNSTTVSRTFSKLCRLLRTALLAQSSDELRDAASMYLKTKKEFRQLLSPNEYKYFAFQLWQEGVARYTELKVAEHIAQIHSPSEAFRQLLDYVPFGEEALRIRKEILADLDIPDLP